LYLEDLYVKPGARGRGLGRALLERLAAVAKTEGCARLEWSVLVNNAEARRFYEGLGAVAQEDFVLYRVTGEALAKLGAGVNR
jgi:ribosomal protein S18 acetylase RimI-like enzyme